MGRNAKDTTATVLLLEGNLPETCERTGFAQKIIRMEGCNPMKVFPISATPLFPSCKGDSGILSDSQPMIEDSEPAALYLKGSTSKNSWDSMSDATTSATSSLLLSSWSSDSLTSEEEEEEDMKPKLQLRLEDAVMNGEKPKMQLRLHEAVGLDQHPRVQLDLHETLSASCPKMDTAPYCEKPTARQHASQRSSETTVMMRNLPNDYTRDMLLELIDKHGFVGQYDFVHLPLDTQRGVGLGYAFINFLSVDQANQFRKHFQGFAQWAVLSRKVCDTSSSANRHGLQAHIDAYRNSPVMHSSVADKFKPAIFVNGVRTQFPAPTRRVSKPNLPANSVNTCSN